MGKTSKVRLRKNAKAEIERLLSQRGGYSKAALASFGVSWPPPKGWKKALIEQMAFPQSKRAKPHTPKKLRSKDFYSSWEWKKLRFEALKAHGHRCQCCGWRPGDTEHGHLVVDHIKPRRKNPELQLELSNLQVLCNDCNMGKSDIYEDDFRDVEDWFRNIMRET